SELTREHLKTYMQAFARLQKQRELQYKLIHHDFRDAASRAEAFFRAHMQQENAHNQSEHLLEDERMLNVLLLIESDAMHYFDSLDPQYIKRVKEGFAEIRVKMQGMDAHRGGQSIALESIEARHNIDEYERLFLEAVQRTRGYLFLVNVVMSAEAYEMLYNARQMAGQVKQEMGDIEQGTFSMLQQVINSIVVAIVISLLLIGLLSIVIARSLTRPVLGLTAAFKALSQGAADTEIPACHSADEIGDLTRAAAVFREKNRQTHVLLEQAKALTEELTESESRFRALVESAADAFLLVDRQGHILDVNRAACESLGYSGDELMKLRVPDVDMKFSDEEVRQVFVHIDRGEALTVEGVQRRKDGSTFPVEVRIGKLEQHGAVFAIALVRDISARKQTEEKVRMLSQAVEQSGEAVAITDADGTIEYVNPAFSEISGYSESEALGQNPRILKSGNQNAAFYEKMWAVLKTGAFWQGKVVNRSKNGEFYPAMLTISPLRNEHGDITNFIGIQQSLAEIERLENQFRQSQKMEAIGTLVGGIAHDFNNNLAGITGNLYMAKKAVKSMPDVVRRLDTIEKLSFGAAATIQQLLAFSRKGIVQMYPLSISSFLKETIKMQQLSLPENIALQLQVEDAGMQVKGDINQLQQMLMNLINNAFDAVQESENPTIRVQLDRFQADDTFAALHEGMREGEYAHISVIDNGSGIKAEHIEHVFEPFFTTKEQGKGTGLGLAMAYGTVKTHGGYIEIKAAEPTGTVVQIYLPLIATGNVVDMGAKEDQVIAGHGETILLVDDNDTVRETASDVLEGLGYKVFTAEDGLLAIEAYRLHRDQIDLVILDVVMPRLGGAEALQEIRCINPDVKALFATGYDKLSTLAAPVVKEKVISKPFAISILSQAIRDLLDQARS
ncbi:MAG: hypothetical protein CO187_08110, partial [Zetaproteobacteria bacterium CG_4_9_14_3_um_filter_53_7]